MIKVFKKLTFVAIAVCVALTSVFATACNKDDPKKEGYIITVLYPDGSPVKGTDVTDVKDYVGVQLVDENDNKLLDKYKSLDNNGVAYTEYKIPGEYKVKFINLPAGYIYDENITTDIKKASLTIQLKYKPTDYQIAVTMPDGSAPQNIKATMTVGETAYEVDCDNQGKATFPTVDAGKYSITLSGIPAHYGYLPITTAMNGEPVEVKLFYINDVTLDDAHKISDTDLAIWGNTQNSEIVKRINTSVANYEYTVDIPARGEVYYAIVAEKSGSYTINAHSDWEVGEDNKYTTVTDSKGVTRFKSSETANYRFKFYGLDFNQEYPDLAIDGSINSGNNTRPISLEAGQVFYFSVSAINRRAYKTTFAISYDVEPHNLKTSATGEYELKFEDIDYAVVQFQPTESGMYHVTSDGGNYDPRIEIYRDLNSPYYATDEDGNTIKDEHGNSVILGDDNHDDDDTYTGKDFLHKEDVQRSYVGNTYVYRIYLKNYDITTHATIKIKIERVGDATPEKVVEKKTAEVKATLRKEANVSGKTFTWMPTTGFGEVVEENGAYYFIAENSTEKHKLYIAITRNFSGVTYSFKTINYIGTPDAKPSEKPSEGNGSSNPTEIPDGVQPTPQRDYLTVYEDLKTLDRTWNYDEFVKQYSNYVNTDGVYELNAELKLFAERYINHRGSEIANNTTPKKNVANGWWWALACGYYA